tara:strand:+ start:13 stop:216 length:204 start_codon:yes stop_codon:yes gene_type:complete
MIRNIIILLLLSLSFGGTVTDIDGNVYETVQIGELILQISYEVMFRDYNNVEISINKIVNGLTVVTP